MVLPINIIAALVTVLSRSITRQSELPRPAVENGSPNIYQIFGSIAIVITGIYYLLRCIANSQAARKSIRNHGMSTNQSLGESSLAESRTVMHPERHSPRSERCNFETEEAKPSTSRVSNLKRPYILEENYPPPKLRNVGDRLHHDHSHHDHSHHDNLPHDHLHHDNHFKTNRSPNPELIPLIVHPEMNTLKINDEPTPGPSSRYYLENLKRPYLLEENYPPPKLRNVGDRLHHDHSHHDHSHHDHSHHEHSHHDDSHHDNLPRDHLHNDNHLKTDISQNPELIPLIVHPKMNTLKINDEPTAGSSSGCYLENLKRPYILEEIDPPPKLPNVGDRLHHDHSHHERSHHDDSHHDYLPRDHLHHDNHLKTYSSPNLELIPLIVHPEMATLKINDEPTAEPSSECYLEEGENSPQNTPSKHRGPGRPRKESTENHRSNHNIDLAAELDLTIGGDNTSQPEGEHMIRRTRSGQIYYGSKQIEKRTYKKNK